MGGGGMNILVTGGAGFMGSHFVKRLLENDSVDDSIFVVDKLTYAGSRKNLPAGSERGYRFINRDIADLNRWDFGQTIRPDVVVNFAAESHVDRSIKDPAAFLRTDIMGLFNLISKSLWAGVKRFVHISTDEVYGPIGNTSLYRKAQAMAYYTVKGKLLSLKDFGIGEASENWLLKPTSPYSASKASADMLLHSYHKTYGLPIIIVRPCNNYGSNQYPEKLIPMAITRLLKGEKVLLHGDGDEIREWIYVEDCVSAIESIMLDGEVGETYNVGSGYRLTNLEVIEKVVDRVANPWQGREHELGFGDEHCVHPEAYIEKTSNRPGNDMRYALNSDKFMKKFGEDPAKVPFVVGLQKTVDWYRENEDWWQGVDLDSNIYDEKEYMR
jgi:dTDP-glucose 4,6-dehydratase